MPRWVTCRTPKRCSGCSKPLSVGDRCYHAGYSDFYCLPCGDRMEFREDEAKLRELDMLRPALSLGEHRQQERVGRFIGFFGGCY